MGSESTQANVSSTIDWPEANHSLDDGDHVQQHVDHQITPQEFVFQSSYDLQKLYLKPHNIPRTMMAYNHHHDLDLDFYAALRLGYTPFDRSGACSIVESVEWFASVPQLQAE